MVKEPAIKIHMFDANEGDCFLITAGRIEPVRILVDSGPSSAWPHIAPELITSGPLRLSVITHIDADHIGGALRMFPDSAAPLINTAEVWFNALPQLLSLEESISSAGEEFLLSQLFSAPLEEAFSGNRDISFPQAATLSNSLSCYPELWNSSFGGGPVSAGAGVISLSGEVAITVLLPTKDGLSAMLKAFERELRSFISSSRAKNSPAMQKAFEFYCRNYRVLTTESVDIAAIAVDKDVESLLSNAKSTPDPSVTNASSIAFILESGGRRVLFLGDAPCRDSIAALTQWHEKTGLPLFFDTIKLPHHGSKQNCLDLLDYIDGSYFLIPTDGKQHGHPSPETIAKLIARPTDAARTLVFSRDHAVMRQFDVSEWKAKYNYQVLCGEEINLT